MTKRELTRTVPVIVPLLLAAACSSQGGDELASDINTEITVCIGTSAGYEKGRSVQLDVECGRHLRLARGA